MTTTTETRTETLDAPLTDEMLARFDERAPTYDRENRSSPRTSRSCARPGTSPPRCPPSTAAPV